MTIRKAQLHDLDAIMRIYAAAKATMAENGNATQWFGGYPSEELLRWDIAQERCYVEENDHGEVHAVFVFLIGPDPTYRVIHSGAWLNDGLYGTIHRLASDGREQGCFAACLEFCSRQIANIRIDTHRNNKTMQHLLAKHGFQECGIIEAEDGTDRIAYQRVSQ